MTSRSVQLKPRTPCLELLQKNLPKNMDEDDSTKIARWFTTLVDDAVEPHSLLLTFSSPSYSIRLKIRKFTFAILLKKIFKVHGDPEKK